MPPSTASSDTQSHDGVMFRDDSIMPCRSLVNHTLLILSLCLITGHLFEEQGCAVKMMNRINRSDTIIPTFLRYKLTFGNSLIT